jgi:hypothetical protein
MLTEHIMKEVDAEIKRAIELHPNWPKDIIHQAGIVCEESGELIQAALDHVYFQDPIEAVRTEAIHTIATCVRLIAAME